MIKSKVKDQNVNISLTIGIFDASKGLLFSRHLIVVKLWTFYKQHTSNNALETEKSPAALLLLL